MKPSIQLQSPGTEKAKKTVESAATKEMKAVVGGRRGRKIPPKRLRVPLNFTGSGVKAHDAVVAGMPGYALDQVLNAFDVVPYQAVLNAIGVSERTAHRIKANPDKPLDIKTTDAIYRLESIRAAAEEVLGSGEAANEWLNAEAIGLEFRKPIELLSTSPGADAVRTLLQRMKFGVYA